MKIKVGSDFSGVGAFEQALKRLGIDFETVFACDMDKFARRTFLANYGTANDLRILETRECQIIDSVYYREYVNRKLGLLPTKEEWEYVRSIEERVARSFSFYYPWNVYARQIPKNPIDLYIPTPPCQAFSIAGKRLGKDDERGILFFNSHEFIRVNKPRFFMFENVKGLLSDDKTSKDDTYGRTFREWINYLGGKSVNGVPVLFPHDEAVPYHIYHTVINAKYHNIPQNRERVFIVGIRDDADNVFSWPQEQPLTKRLRDVLEENVDPKYYLSEKAVSTLLKHSARDNGHKFEVDRDVAKTIRTDVSKNGTDDNYVSMLSDSKKSREREIRDIAPPLRAKTGAGHNDYVVKLRRTDEAKKKRSESLKNTGKDTGSFADRQYELVQQNYADTILANPNPVKDGLIGVIQLNHSTEFKQRKFPHIFRQTCCCGHDFIGSLSRLCPSCNSINSGWTNELRIKRKRKEVCIPVLTPGRLQKRQNGRRFKEDGEPFFTLTAQDKHGIYNGITIRRLTPTECFRLMGFQDTLVQNARAAGISDSQLYKQAGNSIVVDVLANIINGIKPLRLSGDKFK